MASKYSNRKLTSEQKLKRALTVLDSAVQAWYAEHNPENKEHYASSAVFDDPEGGYHICRVTLNSDPAGKKFIDIKGGRYGRSKIKHN